MIRPSFSSTLFDSQMAIAAGTAKVMRHPGQVSSGPRTEALASSITCSAASGSSPCRLMRVP